MRSLILGVACAGLAWAGVEPRWGGYEQPTTTMVTYETVTTCPVTATETHGGKTVLVTKLTTSTITVTACHGCEGGVVTVPGPDVTKGTTTEVEITYTTVCPTTETITAPGTTYVTTKTVTSKVVTRVPTTYYATVTQPGITKTKIEGVTKTITSLCPVTQVTTIGGRRTTLTYTTTSLITTIIPTTVQETVVKPDKTKIEVEGVTKTITSLCPVTQVTTIGGRRTTLTYTTTSLITTIIPTTVQQTVVKPDKTKIEVEGVTKTITSLCPVTQVTTIGGHRTTLTYTTTSLITTIIPTTVQETVVKPDKTKIEVQGVTKTITSLCPVTQVTTIGGHKTTLTYTTTSLITTIIPTTVQETVVKPDKTKIEVQGVTKTITSLCPVTQVTTIGGHKTTLTYTTTSLITTVIPTTIQETVTRPDKTKTAVEGITSVITSYCPVTQVTTIGGHRTTITMTTISLITTVIPTTVQKTLVQPNTTATETDVITSTITSLCPVTQVTTISGHRTTLTYTSTKLIETVVRNTVQQTVFQPGETVTATNVAYQTETNVVPYTQVIYVSGQRQTVTNFKTQVVTVAHSSIIYQSVTAPGQTETSVEVLTMTESHGSEVTEVVTLPGPAVTKVEQSTYVVQESGPSSTVIATTTGAPVGAAGSNHPVVGYVVAGILGALAMI